MTEHSWARGFHKRLFKKSRETYAWKINDNFTNGVPDAFIEGAVRDLWLEYKYIKNLPKRDSTLISPYELMSGNQKLWMDRRWAKRKDALLIVASPEGCVIFTGDTWKPPLTCGAFKDAAMQTTACVDIIIAYLNEEPLKGAIPWQT